VDDAMQPSVFVFTCGTPDLYGLSAQQDGSNLPKAHDCTEAWKFLQAVPMLEEFLKRFTMDPKITILNLAARAVITSVALALRFLIFRTHTARAHDAEPRGDAGCFHDGPDR
jgi:hypothetical protein